MLVDQTLSKKYFNGNCITVGLNLVEVFYLRYGCKIVIT